MIVPKPAAPIDLEVKRGLGTITSASSAPEMTWLDPRKSLAAFVAADCKEQTVHAERPDAQGTPAMKPIALNRKLKKWSAALVRG
jgi:hypothetical protein